MSALLKKPSPFDGMTDEEIVRELRKYLNVDGIVLVYLDNGGMTWFTRWKNTPGRKWCSLVFKYLKEFVKC